MSLFIHYHYGADSVVSKIVGLVRVCDNILCICYFSILFADNLDIERAWVCPPHL